MCEIKATQNEHITSFGPAQGNSLQLVELAIASWRATREYLRYLLNTDHDQWYDIEQVLANTQIVDELPSLQEAKYIQIEFGEHRGAAVGQMTTSPEGIKYVTELLT